jgi:hypothetical protein
MTLQIERDIPMPTVPMVMPAQAMREALEQMLIGESFWLPHYRSAMSNAHTIADRFGMKVTTRLTVKDGQRGVRVWRLR